MQTESRSRTRLEVVRTLPALATALAARGGVALVPTMGALHDGHRALLRAARGSSETVVMSLFVNPTQFLPGEDFERYPRNEQADLEVAEQEAVDIAFVPAVDAIYPPGFATAVEPGPLGDDLEGRARPGHFRGVATVVMRLLGLVHPDRALFGEKDYQQLAVIRSVVRDLALAAEIVGVPTVRAADGLALSSRNRYLTADQHQQALGLHAGLRAAAAAYAAGERDPSRLVTEARGSMQVGPEYLELRRHDLSAYVPDDRAVLLVAARFGSTRLIDNVVLEDA